MTDSLSKLLHGNPFEKTSNKMDGFLAAGVGFAIPASFAYFFYKKQRDYCKVLEHVKLYQIDGDLKESLLKSESIPYAAVSGYVKANNKPLICQHDSNSTPGVIHNTTVTEFKSEWKESSKSWNDIQRIISSATNTVEFSLEDKEGTCRVTVTEPLRSEGLTYSTVHSSFNAVDNSLSDRFIGFVTGEKVKGFETKDTMLIEGTKLTGLGTLNCSEGEIKLCPPLNSYNYILSTSSLASIMRSKTTLTKFLKWISISFGIISSLCLLFWMCKRLQSWHAAQQRSRENETLATENGEADVCNVCLDRPKRVVFLDCGHICSCEVCSVNLTQCPICRAEIRRIVPLFNS